MNSNYINREFSWLRFNERVLDQARWSTVPFFERLRFLSIVYSNLDEFYMVRVGSLSEQKGLVKAPDNKTSLTIDEQLKGIGKHVKKQMDDLGAVYAQWALEAQTYQIKNPQLKDLKANDLDYVTTYFHNMIEHLLSPIIVDKAHPFPHLMNKQVAVSVLLKHGSKTMLAFIPIDLNLLPANIILPKKHRLEYLPIEQVVYDFVDVIFKGYNVVEKNIIRVTRNADLDWDTYSDEDLDFRDTMKKLLKKRFRLSPVRLEVKYESEQIIKSLLKTLNIDKDHCFTNTAAFNYSFMNEVEKFLSLRTKDAFYPAHVYRFHPAIQSKESILSQLNKGDLFFHFPFDAASGLIRFIQEAAQSPKIVSIRITLYRVANVSKIVEALIQAKEAGKEVIVIIELKARFDEEHNIEWSNRLEEAGCTLIFGVEHMKVHSKVCVAIEKDNHKTKLYTHIGTGNYNEQTARSYSDFHLITADQTIGQEALYFLQSIQMGNIERLNQAFKSILVAPYSLKQQLLLDIQKEASCKDGHIILKMNSLTDKDIIDALYAASQAGVKIDLIIRGICCLVPGQKDLSENIQVISVIGRYLEHTRAFLFKHEGEWLSYLSSADLMTRNTEKRLELAVRVNDPNIKTQMRLILFSYLNPEINHYRLDEEGNYQGHRSDIDVQTKQYDFKASPAYERSLWQKMKDVFTQHER